jgi:hypothetical protein
LLGPFNFIGLDLRYDALNDSKTLSLFLSHSHEIPPVVHVSQRRDAIHVRGSTNFENNPFDAVQKTPLGSFVTPTATLYKHQAICVEMLHIINEPRHFYHQLSKPQDTDQLDGAMFCLAWILYLLRITVNMCKIEPLVGQMIYESSLEFDISGW